jgi:hypothetical protein
MGSGYGAIAPSQAIRGRKLWLASGLSLVLCGIAICLTVCSAVSLTKG